MRYIYALSLILVSIAAFGRGGVDVGNGSRKSVPVGYSLPQFQDEMELTQFLKETLNEVKSGSSSQVKEYITQGSCSSEVNFQDLESLNVYVLDKTGEKLEKKTSGLMNVELRDCATPEQIIHEWKPKLKLKK